ncbi:MAG: glycosyltransferase family 4 protein [Firmicutes bacterium]|nr:glycosyltransferase family 4 protein [Alicyclobacillaceae bacterium]MCL6497129.1 glycosyltransferase family 4 protein [Bacillota bacterium]
MISKALVTASYRSKVAMLNARAAGAIEVAVLCPPRWGALPFEPMPDDAAYPLFVRPIWGNGHHHLHRYPALSAVVKAYRPDLLHIDEEHYSWVTFEAAAVARRRRIPALFFTWQNLYKRYPWPFSAFEQAVFRACAEAIAGNRDAEQVLRQKGYRGRITVIPQFGVDPAFTPDRRGEARERYGTAGRFAVGYVGRLVPEKGVGDLLAAAAPLLRSGQTRLLLVGRGPCGAELAREAERLGVAEAVSLLPWVASAEMPAVMRALDVLVLPSRTTARWKEQFGRVLTEAMASGTVVVGSDSGEIPHVIGDAGFVFPEGDVAALRAILERLARDPGLADAARTRGMERVATHFTQAAVADATLAVYRRMLGIESQ